MRTLTIHEANTLGGGYEINGPLAVASSVLGFGLGATAALHHIHHKTETALPTLMKVLWVSLAGMGGAVGVFSICFFAENFTDLKKQ